MKLHLHLSSKDFHVAVLFVFFVEVRWSIKLFEANFEKTTEC